MPLPADTLSKWVRKKSIITFLLFPTLMQKRMIQCLPRRDTFNRFRVQQTFKQIERLVYVRLVILDVYEFGRPVRLA